MKCPIDNIKLEKKIYEGDVEVDVCNICSGIWLDKGELEAIQKLRENNYEQAHTERYIMSSQLKNAYHLGTKPEDRKLSCPKCSQPLIQKEYGYASLILIDVCTNSTCQGIWLDKGELQALEIYYEQLQNQNKKSTHEEGDFISTLLDLFL